MPFLYKAFFGLFCFVLTASILYLYYRLYHKPKFSISGGGIFENGTAVYGIGVYKDNDGKTHGLFTLQSETPKISITAQADNVILEGKKITVHGKNAEAAGVNMTFQDDHQIRVWFDDPAAVASAFLSKPTRHRYGLY